MQYIKKLQNKLTSMSEVTKATFAFFIANLLTKCVSMLSTPIFTRLLSTEQFGIYNTYMSWVSVVVIVATFRLDFGIFNKGMSKYTDQKEEYTATMQSITSIATLILLAIYLVFQNFFNELTGLNTIFSLVLFAEVFFNSSISFWTIRQRYDYKYKAVVFVSVAMALLNAGLGIIGVLLTNHSAYGRIISIAIVQVAFGSVIYVRNFAKSKKWFVLEFAKFAILFNIPLLPHYFASFILEQFDRLMIKWLVGFSAVGIYSVAYSSGFVIKMITTSINSTLLPWQYHKLKDQDFKPLSECVNAIFKCVAICFMAYMALAPEVTRFFGDAQYYSAVKILPPITVSVFLIFIYDLYANVEFFYGDNKFTMVISITAAILNVVLNYIFIPIGGYQMAAYTTLLSYSVLTIGHYAYMRHTVRKHTGQTIFSASSFWISIIGMIVYSFVITFTFETFILRYVIVLALALYTLLARKKLFAFVSLLK